MVHAITIFVSAFLLFLVQLIMAKRILPWFGGAPAVWTTCMLFFQVLLLAGYAYAHFLTSRFSRRAQGVLHVGILVGSLALIGLLWARWGSPILPNDAWKPVSPDQPVWQILKLLAVSIGLPFFILSSTSPLVQRWYSFQGDTSKTYRLYALSNFGSLLGLLGYPFLIEPFTRLRLQGAAWGVLYGVFALACVLCAIRQMRPSALTSETDEPKYPIAQRPGWMTWLLWMLLAMMSSSMLLSVTNNLCQEVAVVPFLWVLPLTLYLLSFIICFDNSRWYSRRWFVLALAASSMAVLATAFLGVRLGIVPHIISYGLFLFLFCMVCHGELVMLKPEPRHLTLFYLMISVGGALGGLFVGIVAPMIFKGYYEFHFTLMLGWVVLVLVFVRDRTSFFFTGDRWCFYVTLFLAGYVFFRMALFFGLLRGTWIAANALYSALAASLLVTLAIALGMRSRAFVNSKYWPRILVGAVIFVAECFLLNRVRSAGPMTIALQRNFYGVTRVETRFTRTEPKLEMVNLAHGQISHGVQFRDLPARTQPVGYYSTNSGIAVAFRYHPRRMGTSVAPMNVGVLGLGVGTLAAYGQGNDQFRFYEINPAVLAYSQGEQPLFSYLKDSPSRLTVELGDARLSLEKEVRAGEGRQFDILVMDAFSSDSVPVHLLTAEAFELYLKHMRDEDSIIAVNISNRFLDFRDLMFSVGKRMGLQTGIIECPGGMPDRTPSRWCLLSRSQRLFQLPEVKGVVQAYSPTREVIWTDDFSNLFQLVRRD